MRKFEEYRNSVMEHVKKLLGKGYAITEQEIQKDNGIIWRGIGIQKESDPAVVIFYIDDVDEQYIEDINMVEMTASDIVRIYIDQEKEKKKLIDITWAMRDFETAKERIRFRLINADNPVYTDYISSLFDVFLEDLCRPTLLGKVYAFM